MFSFKQMPWIFVKLIYEIVIVVIPRIVLPGLSILVGNIQAPLLSMSEISWEQMNLRLKRRQPGRLSAFRPSAVYRKNVSILWTTIVTNCRHDPLCLRSWERSIGVVDE